MKLTRTEHSTERWEDGKNGLKNRPLSDLVKDICAYAKSHKAEQLEIWQIYEVIIGDVIYILEKTVTTKGSPHYKVVTIYKNSTQYTEGTFVTTKRKI